MAGLPADCVFSFDPRFLVFEFVLSLLLRERQVELVRDMAQAARETGRSQVNQMIMGAGKTTVISPMLALMLADGVSLVVQVVPARLLRQTLTVLRERFSTVIGKSVFTLHFDRRASTSHPSQLQRLAWKLEVARKQHAVVCSTPTAIKSLMLRYIDCMQLLEDAPDIVFVDADALPVHPKGLRENAAKARQNLRQARRSALLLAKILQMWGAAGRRNPDCGPATLLAARGRVLLDEVDEVLHPLRSELNFPIGPRSGPDLGRVRWDMPMFLTDALLYAAGTTPSSRRIAVDSSSSSCLSAAAAARCCPEALKELSSKVDLGVSCFALQRRPHLVLLQTSFYHAFLKSHFATWLMGFLQCQAPLLTDFQPDGGHNPAPEQLGANEDGDGDVRRAPNAVTGKAFPEPVTQRILEYITTLQMTPGCRTWVSQHCSPESVKVLNLARDWLVSLLPHCMQKVCRVTYGRLSDWDRRHRYSTETFASMPATRKKLAVPFVGKDTPSASSEFAHLDVLVGLTVLAARYEGLRRDDVQTAVVMLRQHMKRQPGPVCERPARLKFDRWLQLGHSATTSSATANVAAAAGLTRGGGGGDGGGGGSSEDNESATNHDYNHNRDDDVVPLELIALEDEAQLSKLHRRLRRVPEVALFFLSLTFPGIMDHQKTKLTASGMDLGSDMLFDVRLGFSGTPTHLLPPELKQRCFMEPGSDASIVRLLTSPAVVVECRVLHRWSVTSLIADIATASPPFHALIDTGALVTGLTNVQVARQLLRLGMRQMEGCVYLDGADRKMVVLRSSIDGAPVPLSECGLPPARRCTFYDQAHTVGMDIHQELDARAAVTVGKDMTFRDYSQGCWRMRGLHSGQSLVALIPEEVYQLVKDCMALAAPRAGRQPHHHQQQRQRHSTTTRTAEPPVRVQLLSWLVVNSMRSQHLQHLQLSMQSITHVSRRTAFKDLLWSSLRASGEPPEIDGEMSNRTGDGDGGAHQLAVRRQQAKQGLRTCFVDAAGRMDRWRRRSAARTSTPTSGEHWSGGGIRSGTTAASAVGRVARGDSAADFDTAVAAADCRLRLAGAVVVAKRAGCHDGSNDDDDGIVADRQALDAFLALPTQRLDHRAVRTVRGGGGGGGDGRGGEEDLLAGLMAPRWLTLCVDVFREPMRTNVPDTVAEPQSFSDVLKDSICNRALFMVTAGAQRDAVAVLCDVGGHGGAKTETENAKGGGVLELDGEMVQEKQQEQEQEKDIVIVTHFDDISRVHTHRWRISDLANYSDVVPFSFFPLADFTVEQSGRAGVAASNLQPLQRLDPKPPTALLSCNLAGQMHGAPLGSSFSQPQQQLKLRNVDLLLHWQPRWTEQDHAGTRVGKKGRARHSARDNSRGRRPRARVPRKTTLSSSSSSSVSSLSSAASRAPVLVAITLGEAASVRRALHLGHPALAPLIRFRRQQGGSRALATIRRLDGSLLDSQLEHEGRPGDDGMRSPLTLLSGTSVSASNVPVTKEQMALAALRFFDGHSDFRRAQLFALQKAVAHVPARHRRLLFESVVRRRYRDHADWATSPLAPIMRGARTRTLEKMNALASNVRRVVRSMGLTLRESFHHFDRDGDGWLSSAELAQALQQQQQRQQRQQSAVGRTLSADDGGGGEGLAAISAKEIATIFQDVQPGNTLLTYQDFVVFCADTAATAADHNFMELEARTADKMPVVAAKVAADIAQHVHGNPQQLQEVSSARDVALQQRAFHSGDVRPATGKAAAPNSWRDVRFGAVQAIGQLHVRVGGSAEVIGREVSTRYKSSLPTVMPRAVVLTPPTAFYFEVTVVNAGYAAVGWATPDFGGSGGGGGGSSVARSFGANSNHAVGLGDDGHSWALLSGRARSAEAPVGPKEVEGVENQTPQQQRHAVADTCATTAAAGVSQVDRDCGYFRTCGASRQAGPVWRPGDVIGAAADLETGVFRFFVNNVLAATECVPMLHSAAHGVELHAGGGGGGGDVGKSNNVQLGQHGRQLLHRSLSSSSNEQDGEEEHRSRAVSMLCVVPGVSFDDAFRGIVNMGDAPFRFLPPGSGGRLNLQLHLQLRTRQHAAAPDGGNNNNNLLERSPRHRPARAHVSVMRGIHMLRERAAVASAGRTAGGMLRASSRRADDIVRGRWAIAGNGEHGTAALAGVLLTRGKWWFEVEHICGRGQVGVADAAFLASLAATAGGGSMQWSLGYGRHSWAYETGVTREGVVLANGPCAFGEAWDAGATLGVAVDLDEGAIWFAINGRWRLFQRNATFAGGLCPAVTCTDLACRFAFGPDELAYAPPSSAFKSVGDWLTRHRVRQPEGGGAALVPTDIALPLLARSRSTAMTRDPLGGHAGVGVDGNGRGGGGDGGQSDDGVWLRFASGFGVASLDLATHTVFNPSPRLASVVADGVVLGTRRWYYEVTVESFAGEPSVAVGQQKGREGGGGLSLIHI